MKKQRGDKWTNPSYETMFGLAHPTSVTLELPKPQPRVGPSVDFSP